MGLSSTSLLAVSEHNTTRTKGGFLLGTVRRDGFWKATPCVGPPGVVGLGLRAVFDMIKETIARCDKERPRFHAFLKVSKVRECINHPGVDPNTEIS